MGIGYGCSLQLAQKPARIHHAKLATAQLARYLTLHTFASVKSRAKC